MSRRRKNRRHQHFAGPVPALPLPVPPIAARTTDNATPTSTPEAPEQPVIPKIMVSPMDLFRAQDAASKAVLRDAVSRAVKAGTTDGFDNFISRVGLNNDNALSGSTYAFNLVTRNRTLLEAAYRGSWIVGQVIDTVAEDMTRSGITVTTAKGGKQIQLFQRRIKRLQIWNSSQTLIKWGRLYGGAIGVIQIAGQDLSTPLRLESVAKGQFKGIVVYDRWQLNPVLTEVIEEGPDMGLPKFYQIVSTPLASSPEAPTPTGQQTVHHSRCIRYTGIDLPFYQAITEMMWGESILERLWDRLIAFDNATMSSASLIDRANLRTVSIQGLREIIAAGGEAQAGLEKMFEMMRIMQVNEGLTLVDAEDDVNSTAYSFAGLSDMMLQFGQQLAGASGIPLVRLFGQSPAGLSATGDADIRMYYDNINAQQEAKLRDPFEVVVRVIWQSEFGVPAPDDLEFSFTPLWQMSATDKAIVAKTNTDTVIAAHQDNLVPTGTAMRELRNSSGDTGLFANISDEDIVEAELEPPPLPDEPVLPDDPKKEPVKTVDDKFRPWLDWFTRRGTGGSARRRRRRVRDADFKENDHPRSSDGKFSVGQSVKTTKGESGKVHRIHPAEGMFRESVVVEYEHEGQKSYSHFRKFKNGKFGRKRGYNGSEGMEYLE